ncbi:hypothetical protein C1Y40_05779 [Mycobacterium talmoniae]|uniref:Precorrin-3B synthase n=1 Tax=Mycobacterium talmoniae TaxID=1858794 RepID=A0A2S8BBN1_9MYCO|nr:hypothetical protein C1Y40_05779 [Mycobacterium talmoniae]
MGVHVLDDAVALLLSGRDTGVRLAPSDVVGTFGHAGGAVPGDSRNRVASNGIERSARPAARRDPDGARFGPVERPPVGWIEQDAAGWRWARRCRWGVLSAHVAEYLAVIGAPLVITPWRSVLVCDLEEAVADAALRVLAPLGLVFDADSPWLMVSACVGSPGCRHAVADVRADAAAPRRAGDADTGRRHFVGCERACGAPPAGQVLVATGLADPAYRVLPAHR